MQQLFERISNILKEESELDLSLPDEIIQDIVISQYTYKIYSKYDVILNIKKEAELNKLAEYSGKTILLFIKEKEIKVAPQFFRTLNLKCIYFGRHKQNVKKITFTVSENLSINYIKYIENEFPQIIFSDKDRKEVINLGGYNFSNIYRIMQLCYWNQVTVGQIHSRRFVDSGKKDSDINKVLNLCAKGICIDALRILMGTAKIEEYISKKYIFLNGRYAIPNVELKLKYRIVPGTLDEKWWQNILVYVQNLDPEEDKTICEQVGFNLKNMLLDIKNEKFKDCLYEIERILFVKYRFRENPVLLDLLGGCKAFFEKDNEKKIGCLVDEAILYMDIEEFSVSKEKFKQALKLCQENSIKKEVWIFVEDEYSRLLEKMGHYYEALKKLDFVRKFYQENKNEKKLDNVKNRIGLNLSFIGDIKSATYYLESLLLGNFNNKIEINNILSCEVANNLSVCYMEAGLYKKALRIQNLLYQLYLRSPDKPVNYATDILQNKGNIYLYKEQYEEAFKCFEQALQDETNPFSRELILENYLYAQGFLSNNFGESIAFFESQIEGDEKNYETCKMLAEMYWANEDYSKCARLSKKILNQITYDKETFIYISLDVMYISSMKKLRKLTTVQKCKYWLRIIKYERFIKEHVGCKSPYWLKVMECKNGLARRD